MKKRTIFISLLFFVSATVISQNAITGTFTDLANQQVKLVGFNGFDTYTIDSIHANEKGEFQLLFGTEDFGMAYLLSEDYKSFVVVLVANENLQLAGVNFALPETILIKNSKQNKQFIRYSIEHPKRERTLNAWIYLQKIYQRDSLFTPNKLLKASINTEIKRIKLEDENFLKSLDQHTYVSWFLPVRKLVSSVSTIAQYRTDEIPATLAAFRNLDYANDRLYKSGLLKDVIESHFWLIENMGLTLDSAIFEMGISIDVLLANLSQNENRFNEITQYLFNLLEKRSLFQASEYLALKVLTQNACTVNDDLASQMEKYRAMKKGNTAPDIVFAGDVFINGKLVNSPMCLSDIQTDYKVLIFGAGWCSKCAEELGRLPSLYKKWKSNGVDVVFISLDTERTLFKSFSSIFPFISTCDYRKWEGQAVNDYFVFATPTLFLLDKDHKIVLRPKDVQQMDAWVDWYLVKGKQ